MIKNINPVYSSLKGGFSSASGHCNCWQYTFCYNIFRFCKGSFNAKLKIPGVYYSLHINTYSSYINLPKFLKNKAYNFHFAFIKNYPFIVTGFRNVWNYMEEIY